MTTDAELLAALTAGDHAALGALYARHAPALQSLAEHLLKDSPDAQDLVHDVLLEAWEKAHTYAPHRGSVQTWLQVRLRSRVLDCLKSPRRQRMVQLDAVHLDHLDFATEDTPLRSYLGVVARHGCQGLSTELGLLVELVYLQGQPLERIAKQLRWPLGTVKSRLRRLLEQLREAPTPSARAAQIEN